MWALTVKHVLQDDCDRALFDEHQRNQDRLAEVHTLANELQWLRPQLITKDHEIARRQSNLNAIQDELAERCEDIQYLQRDLQDKAAIIEVRDIAIQERETAIQHRDITIAHVTSEDYKVSVAQQYTDNGRLRLLTHEQFKVSTCAGCPVSSPTPHWADCWYIGSASVSIHEMPDSKA